MNEVLTLLLTSVAPALGTGLLGWWGGSRKKEKAEADTTMLDNVSKSLDIYQRIINDLGVKVKALEDRIACINELLTKSEAENKELKKRLGENN